MEEVEETKKENLNNKLEIILPKVRERMLLLFKKKVIPDSESESIELNIEELMQQDLTQDLIQDDKIQPIITVPIQRPRPYFVIPKKNNRFKMF